MNKNDGTVVVITGANDGIGFNTAKGLLELGYCVAGFDIADENLFNLQKSFPDRLIYFKTDVTKDFEVEDSVNKVIERWRHIDVLMNNACLAFFTPFEQKDIEDTKREFEVNYFGYIRMVAAVLPYMKERGKGIIHNVSSSVGLTGFPGIYGYSSTKGAVEALTLTLAMELDRYGITVNIMHPPLTNTKSASPLGVPTPIMVNPAKVGLAFARKMMVTKPVITPDLQTAVNLFLSRRFPVAIGRFLGKMTEKERAKRSS